MNLQPAPGGEGGTSVVLVQAYGGECPSRNVPLLREVQCNLRFPVGGPEHGVPQAVFFAPGARPEPGSAEEQVHYRPDNWHEKMTASQASAAEGFLSWGTIPSAAFRIRKSTTTSPVNAPAPGAHHD